MNVNADARPPGPYHVRWDAKQYPLTAGWRLVATRAVALAYLTDTLFDRSVVSIGLSSPEDAQFTASEGIWMPEAG